MIAGWIYIYLSECTSAVFFLYEAQQPEISQGGNTDRNEVVRFNLWWIYAFWVCLWKHGKSWKIFRVFLSLHLHANYCTTSMCVHCKDCCVYVTCFPTVCHQRQETALLFCCCLRCDVRCRRYVDNYLGVKKKVAGNVWKLWGNYRHHRCRQMWVKQIWLNFGFHNLILLSLQYMWLF